MMVFTTATKRLHVSTILCPICSRLMIATHVFVEEMEGFAQMESATCRQDRHDELQSSKASLTIGSDERLGVGAT
jgi:hypothetical protein